MPQPGRIILGIIALFLVTVLMIGLASDDAAIGAVTSVLSATAHPTIAATASPEPRPTSDLGAIVSAEAPAPLRNLVLPDTDESAHALIASLPSEIAGQPRTSVPHSMPPELIIVPYGDPWSPAMAFGTEPVTSSVYPGWTAEDQIVERLLTLQSEHEGGRDGNLFWVKWQDAGRIQLKWGVKGGSWVFGASADTAQHLNALLDAFAVVAMSK